VKSKALRASFVFAEAAALVIAATTLAAEPPTAKDESFFIQKNISTLSDKKLGAIFARHSVTFKNLETGRTTTSFYDDFNSQKEHNLYRQDGKLGDWEITDDNAIMEVDYNDKKPEDHSIIRQYSVYEYEKVLYICNYSKRGYCGDIIVGSVKGNKL
jgi:hypothetical protein